MDERARLWVDGRGYEGWTSVSITRSLEALAGSFRLGVSERWPGQAAARPIRPGAACVLKIGDTPVITGYVDDVAIQYDAASHSVEVSGRDKTGDLVDCSALSTSGGRWAGQKLEQIAADLCRPFGVTVSTTAETGAALPAFALQPGESVFEALERAARLRGLLLLSDGLGGLALTRAKGARVRPDLVAGENILSASADFSHKERYSEILVRGDVAEHSDGGGASIRQGRALDAGIGRHRPKLILPEAERGLGDYQTRAEWERSVRLGRGSRARVTVQGWLNKSGVWAPNTLVYLSDPWLSLDQLLLITSVALRLDERGTVTELELCHPAAYDLPPTPEEVSW